MLVYESSLRMAFSDNPSFPDEENAQAASCSTVEPLSIEEWQTYFVKFYGDPAPPPLKQAKFVVREIQPCLWELNFRNYVGLSRIGCLNVVVQNKKISNDLYRAMLGELASSYAALVFDFGSPVGQHYNKAGTGKDCAFVEYLFLCKYLLHDTPNLDAIGDVLVYDPHRRFERELRSCPIEECQAADINIIQNLVNSPMARLQSGHALQLTNLAKLLKIKTQQNLYPARAAKEIKYLTVDTHENRFIKFFLQMLLAKIESLHGALVDGTRSYFNPDINQNLELLRKKIGLFLSHNMWRDVGEMRYVPASSQVLHRKEGYRQLFRLYSLLQLATHCDFLETDFKNLVEIKDVPTIYEYWCFFQVKAVMDSLARICKVSRIINENPLTHELSPGLRIDYAGGAQLFFNKNYWGSEGVKEISEVAVYEPSGCSYSHTLRPDIVIVQNDQKLIFDAKYKGQHSGFYGEENNDGTIKCWKIEDIDKMHTYHDAIKGVRGSFILYPGSQTIFYPCYGRRNPYDGVGAIALRAKANSESAKCSTDETNIRAVISAFLSTNLIH